MEDTLFAKPVALFTALDSAALRDVKASSRIKALGAGSAYFREGDPANAFFVLEKGSVKLAQLTPEGHQVVLRLIGPGDAFGGVAAFGGATYPITAEAVTEASALEWPGEVMMGLMEQYPRLALNALKFVAARMHELQVQYRQLATKNVEYCPGMIWRAAAARSVHLIRASIRDDWLEWSLRQTRIPAPRTAETVT